MINRHRFFFLKTLAGEKEELRWIKFNKCFKIRFNIYRNNLIGHKLIEMNKKKEEFQNKKFWKVSVETCFPLFDFEYHQKIISFAAFFYEISYFEHGFVWLWRKVSNIMIYEWREPFAGTRKRVPVNFWMNWVCDYCG